MTADHYKTLGVAENAGADEIKKAYRKLAKRYHPDRNKGDKTAEDKFKEVQAAYSVLSDDKQRREYDMMRKYGGFTGAPGGGGINAGDFDFGDLFRGRQGQPSGRWTFRFGDRGEGLDDFGDLFGSLFGRESAGERFAQRPPRTSRGADVDTEVTISFMEAINGVQKTLRLAGRGRKIRVRIPAGIEEGGKIRLRGQGEPSPFGGENGDLIITVHVMTDQNFARVGNDIHTSVEISFIDAIKGCKVNVKALTRTVALTIPPGTQPGAKLRLKGIGLSVGDTTGDLYVEVKVTLPTKLTEKQRRLLEEWEEL